MSVEQWKTYKAEHNKSYPADEDAKRFEVFKENFKFIEAHNAKHAKGEVTFTVGLNHTSDWFPEETKRLCGALPPTDDA